MARPSGRGAVTSVNGQTGPVVLDGDDLAFTPTHSGTKADGVTTVAGMLDHNHLYVGTAGVWWSEPTLEAVAPVNGSTYEVTTPTIGTVPLTGAPINLPAGRDAAVIHPGSVLGLGTVKVALIGDVVGPLVHGETVLDGLTLINVSADSSSRDLEVTTTARFVSVDDVVLAGAGGVTVKDTTAPIALRGLILAPPAPGSRGIEFDGAINSVFVTGSFTQAPAGGDYTAYTVLDTCTVDNQFFFDTNSIVTQSATDHLLHIDSASTLPGGAPLPTSVVGVGVFGCAVLGPGLLFDPTGRGADDIQLVSRDHLNASRSNYIGDVRVNTTGAPPILLDHTGSADLPIVIPADNSGNGGTGGTLRTLTLTAAVERHSLLLDVVDAASVAAGGTYTGSDNDYPATQASTSGSGTGAEFTVTLAGGTITAVVSLDKLGEGYAIGDTITLAVVGPTETVAAVLDVDAVGWVLRTDGAVSGLTGPIAWRADVRRGGGAGSTVFGYITRRSGGIGPWVEVDGTRSTPLIMTATSTQINGATILNDIGPGDEWRVVLVNNNIGSNTTLVEVLDLADSAES